MTFSLRGFADLVRPSVRRKSPSRFDGSVFDAGSPQYVRPEDLTLDITSQLFHLPRKSAADLGGTDPADFSRRWLTEAAPELALSRVGSVKDEDILEATTSLLRSARRKKEEYPVLVPLLPQVGRHKNIKPNLPNTLRDQLIPALAFGDDSGWTERISRLATALLPDSGTKDTVAMIGAALLPGTIGLQGPEIFEQPLVRDFSNEPSTPIPVCRRLTEMLDVLVSLRGSVPRLSWAKWITAFFRLSLPLFFLRRCAITASGADAVKRVLAGNPPPSGGELTKVLLHDRPLLRGSREWLNQIAPIVQQYVRARLEISIVLDLCSLDEWLAVRHIDATNPDHRENILEILSAVTPTTDSSFLTSKEPVLSMPTDRVDDRLALDDWLKDLELRRPRLEALSIVLGGSSTEDVVERVYAYLRPVYEPLRSGFGKNANEFVGYTLGAPRKVDRDPEYPDEYNLLHRGEGGKRARRVSVEPGPELLALLVQLLAETAHEEQRFSARLGDLLDLLEDIGLDFRSEPADFDSITNELLRLGLLQSSADAAEAASLKPKFSLRN